MALILGSNNLYPQSSPAPFGTMPNATPAPSTPVDPVQTVNVLIQQIMGSSDPKAAFEQMISGSPEAQNAMQLINQYGNGDFKTAFMNYAAAQGKTALAQQLMAQFHLT